MIFLRDIVKRCPGAERIIRIHLKERWDDCWPGVRSIFDGLIREIPEELQGLVFVSSGESLSTGYLILSCVDPNLEVKDQDDQESKDAAEALKVEDKFPEMPWPGPQRAKIERILSEMSDEEKEDLDNQVHDAITEMLPFVKPSDVIKEAAAASSNNFHNIETIWNRMQEYYHNLVSSKRPDDDIEDHMLIKHCIQALRPMMVNMLQIYMLYIDFDVPDLVIFEINSQLQRLEKSPAAGRWWFHDEDKLEYIKDYPEETAEYLMYVYYRQVLKYLLGEVKLSGNEFTHTDIEDLKQDFICFDDKEKSWIM